MLSFLASEIWKNKWMNPFFVVELLVRGRTYTPTYSLCILLLFLNYCPYSGCILTGNWIVTLQKFMILAVNPLQAEDRNVKHNSLQDLLGVWFMQILLNRFLPLWIVSLYNLGSADIYNAKAITSCNHPNCIDSFISTALFIWKILSMDPCITFMSCWAHKYFPWISPYINPIGSLCLH